AAVLYQFFSTYPLALHELHGLPEPQIRRIYAINTLLIVVLEMVLVRRLADAPPLRVAAWGTLLFGTGFPLLPLGRSCPFVAATVGEWQPLGRSYLSVAARVVVWTFGEMLSMPFLETVAASRGDERSRGRYLGAYNFAYSIAFAGAPALGAWLYQRFGAVPLFAGIGVWGVMLWLGLRTLSPRFANRPRTTIAADEAAPAVAALVPPAS